MIDLPTAADLPREESPMAKVARHSREKGSNYERDVAKKIAGYFGFQWGDAFFRTKPHGRAQPQGDIQPINQMALIWGAAKLGPLECKNQKIWSFDQLFKNAEKSHLYGYWSKSNQDTKKENTVLFFTKAGVTDYVMHLDDNFEEGPVIHFSVGPDFFTKYFTIQTLKGFLKSHWPEPHSVL